ncbi:hypothetical protein [Streptomyces sp. NPDC058371]|uniref:hypothetical protein n=1 Tax=Streptomyces sp. NPDC058371 TaxID=3346463 RepID=UPI003661DADB
MTIEQDQQRGVADRTAQTPDTADEPTGDERAAWRHVQRRATGMSHHEAKAARDAARDAADSSSLSDGEAVRAGAEAEEWERVTDALADHAGTYDPDIDPFVQGERAARADHGRSSREDE